MSKHTTGAWLGMLGKLVSAAGNRDASAWEQCEQVAAAHTELFNELRRMDEVQAELLEALEDCANWLDWLYHPDHDDKHKSNLRRIERARAAIAKARSKP